MVSQGEPIMNEEQYNAINGKLNYCIGRITVPMMRYRDEDIKAVHTCLLEIAGKLDDFINETEEDLDEALKNRGAK
jgi:hypothetical protein